MNPLTGWQIVVVFGITLICSAVCIVVPFSIITKSQPLIEVFTKGSPIYLRGVTVILIVWTTGLLAVHGSLNEGASAIFGVIVGYVFGAINVKKSETPGES